MKLNTKKFIFPTIFALLLFLLIFLVNIVYSSFLNKLTFEEYLDMVFNNFNNSPFSIDKITLFSSCSADSIINSNNTTTINNLTQFTDIALFINSVGNEYTAKNTLKSVSIEDISFNTMPSLGTPNLYYKSLTSFAKSDVLEENLIDSRLDFSVSSDDEIDYSKPILFNNCANPITLSYVCSNIVNDYTISNSDSITYDGSLLKNCNILLNDIFCSISFTVYIENNVGDRFKCPVYISIPLDEGSTSIYDGSYVYTYNPNYTFYRYK